MILKAPGEEMQREDFFLRWLMKGTRMSSFLPGGAELQSITAVDFEVNLFFFLKYSHIN